MLGIQEVQKQIMFLPIMVLLTMSAVPSIHPTLPINNDDSKIASQVIMQSENIHFHPLELKPIITSNHYHVSDIPSFSESVSYMIGKHT